MSADGLAPVGASPSADSVEQILVLVYIHESDEIDTLRL